MALLALRNESRTFVPFNTRLQKNLEKEISPPERKQAGWLPPVEASRIRSLPEGGVNKGKKTPCSGSHHR